MNGFETGKLRQIYGLDFGTSNTHLSLSTAGDSSPIVDDVKTDSNSSIPSIVLYDDRTFEIIGFGQPAIEEWYSMSKKDRKRFVLGTGFKQRLAFNKRAETETTMFLKTLFENLYRQRLIADIHDAEHYALTCGVPSKTVKDHTQMMSEILKKITGNTPILIEEPLGALFYHINRRDITKEDASRGVLVIDFGGGTLDFAYLKNFKTQKVWGSPVIGGILFDDLFYNIFLEQNRGVEKSIKEEGIDGYLRTVFFKSIKEKYSSLVSSSTKQEFRENVSFAASSFGSFYIENNDFFLNHMKNYTPSSELIHDMAGLESFNELIKGNKVDLVANLHKELMRGTEEYTIKKDAISLIILTGGSSRWQFFLDMITKEFPYTRIISSSDPEATISRGLGLCYSARLYEEKVRKELRGTKKELIQKLQISYKEIFNSSLKSYFEKLFLIYEPVIKKEIAVFFKSGGTLNELELKLEKSVKDQKVLVENTTSGFLSEVNFRIENKTKEALSQWFNKSMVKFEFAKRDSLSGSDKLSSENELEGISKTLFNRITTISSLIVGVVTGSLASTAIFIPAVTGLGGWLIGFIGAVTVLVASLAGFKKQMTRGIKNIKLPKWFLKTMMINERFIIKKASQSLEKSLKQNEAELMEKADSILNSNDKKLEQLIEEQIDKISYSNIIDFL